MINHELTHRLNLWAKSNPRLLARQGLCYHIQRISGLDDVRFDHDSLVKYYQHYSGSRIYPVASTSSDDDCPEVMYLSTRENLYINNYGQRRLNLLASLTTAEVHEIHGEVLIVLTETPKQPVPTCTIAHGSQNLLFYNISEQGIDYVHKIIEDFQEIKP